MKERSKQNREKRNKSKDNEKFIDDENLSEPK